MRFFLSHNAPRSRLSAAGDPATRLPASLILPLLLSTAAADPATGNWAGNRMTLRATAAGARLSLDCAAGSIDGPIAPDRIGHFTAIGRLAVYRPGPQLADEPAPDVGARFAGTIRHGRMILTITRDGADPQKFTLVRGAATKPVRCL